MSYFHAGGIDRPLTIWKSGVGSVLPQENWRGQFAMGIWGVGAQGSSGSLRGARSDCPYGGAPNCIPLAWPGFSTNAWGRTSAQGGTSGDPTYWMGSLVDGMRDRTGQQYMRNRYYDPTTGQFTQPDPIGIAGGLNTYGFAAGDPVSYSDPYGLRVDSIKVEGEVVQMNVTYLRNHSPTFRRVYDALDADPNVRILIRGARTEEEDQLGTNAFHPPGQDGGWSLIFLSVSASEQANLDNARSGRSWRYRWVSTIGHEIGHAAGYYGKEKSACATDPPAGGSGCIVDFENRIRSELPKPMRDWLGVREYY